MMASGWRHELSPVTLEPQNAAQMVAFHPIEQRRVISPLTAAECGR